MNRSQIAAYLNDLTYVIILGVAVITPLLFVNLTSEFYEFPKLVFLVSATLLLLLLWTFSWVVSGKVTITRTPLDLPLILLLVVLLVSTFFSESRYISILGNLLKIHGSAVSWVCYIIFYFIATSNIRRFGQIKNLFLGILASSTLVSIITLLSYFGRYLPLKLTAVANFTPTGSSFSTAALLILVLPLPILSLLKPNRTIPLPIAVILTTLFGVTIALIGDMGTQIAGTIIFVLAVMLQKRSEMQKNNIFLLIPIFVILIVFFAGFIPLGKSGNPLFNKRLAFVNLKEIQLPFKDSWKISASAFRDAPFFGSGPSTYLFNFTQYKSVEYNSGKYWNVRFDQAYNEYLQIFGTLGGMGLLGFVFLTAVVINLSWSGLFHHTLRDGTGDQNLARALSLSGFGLIIMWLFHVSTLVSTVMAILILAMLMVLHKLITGKTEDLTIGIKAAKTSADSNLITQDVLPVILFIPIIILVITASWYLVNITRADALRRQAIVTSVQPGKAKDTYDNLVLAERLNPWTDLYRKDLAQINFALANAIATQKGPTEALPEGSLTDQDKTSIQQLLSQSINEAQSAVTLSPKSSQNWEILASIYRQITGVSQNALAFSLDAYGRAIQTDPLNPQLRLNVGGVYYSIKNYDLAIRFFEDAINLKPDFANAYYNLSVGLRDKGDLVNAQAAGEQVVALLQKDSGSSDDKQSLQSGDLKVASDYLADLKAMIATTIADKKGQPVTDDINPPAARETGALQNKNLPELPVDLKTREEVATPEAIKKPGESSSPQPTPEP